uniref:G protein pathway suppressor 2 n=1 Tax=Strigamia maritima TaxID=126957 RepID=T1ITI9_STRMM
MPALIERPKMSRAMWETLKNHIVKERQKKKQEQEADAAIERMRRERENKQKQDVMTLEETKEQIQHLEQRLGQLKDEKHQLFLQLKKVLNEDEIRRRAVPKETNDMLTFGHGYPPPMQMGRHPVFLQTGAIPGRNTLYKMGMPQQHHLTSASLKRPRSPSPPMATYSPGYSFKAQTSQNPKLSSYSQSGGAYYHHHGSSQTVSSTPPYSSQPVYTYSTHSSYPPGPVPTGAQQSPSGSAEPKHVPHSYHVQHLPTQSYGPPLPSQLEQSAHKSGYAEEMYYGVQGSIPLRTSSGVHHGQTLVLAPQQSKPGGITSGYPVRGQGTSSSSGNFQSQPSQHQTAYVGPRHSFSNQGQSAGRYY